VDGALAISTSSLPAGTYGTSYTATLGATGGVGSYSFTWSAASGSTLPPGLTLSSGGVASGTPTATGTYNVVVTASDANSSSADTTTQTFSIAIGTKALTVSGVTASKAYDGTTAATLNVSSAALNGVVGSDNVTLVSAGYTATYASKNVGSSIAVTIVGLSLGGTAAGNYTLTQPTVTGAITARPITVTAAGSSKTYDGTTASSATPTITSGSLASGDSATWTQTYDNANVGTAHVLTPAGTVSDGNSGANYSVSLTSVSTGVITTAALTVTANNINWAQGGTWPPAYTANYSGFVNGESSGVLGGTLAFTTTATSTSSVGTYPITPSGLTSSNYSITFANGTLTITLAISGNVAAAEGTTFAKNGSLWHMFATLWDSNTRYIRTYWRTMPLRRMVASLLVRDAHYLRLCWRTISVPRMVASLFVTDAYAANNPGVTSVGAGVTVELIQVDNSGNPVGNPLATATTDSSGNYTLAAPAGFTPGANYVVQAIGATTLQSFVTSTSVNVDPYTSTTVTLITGSVSQASGALTNVSSADVTAVQNTVLQTTGDVSTTSTTSATLASSLKSVITNNIESNNIVTSIPSLGSITGTVTDSSSTPLANIHIMVRTFGDQVTMAVTTTDISGNYIVHVPAGNYVVCALNATTTSMASSEWWVSNTSVTLNLHQASKITVGTTAVTANFQLPAGGRISGTVTGGSSTNPLAGILVNLYDFATTHKLMWIRTLPDGTFNFNIAQGTYYLTFENESLSSQQPYGSAVYTGAAGGGTNGTQGQKFTVVAGNSYSASITLATGYSISGYIYTDTTDTTPVPGMVIRIQDSTGAYFDSLRTQKDGSMCVWLQSGTYNLLARGQIKSSLTVSSTTGNITGKFDANVATMTGVLQDSSTNPVSDANVFVYGTLSTSSFPTIGYEISDGDGSFSVYADPAATSTYASSTTPTVLLTAVVTDGYPAASQAYNGKLNYPTNGTQITLPAAGGTLPLGTITLPAGAILSGVVTVGGSATGNQIVQVRYGGNGGSYRLVNTRTKSDGSYQIVLPASTTINCVAAYGWNYSGSTPSCPNPATPTSGYASGSYAWQKTVLMGAQDSTYTLNFSY
jgi:hypothetical protein